MSTDGVDWRTVTYPHSFRGQVDRLDNWLHFHSFDVPRWFGIHVHRPICKLNERLITGEWPR